MICHICHDISRWFLAMTLTNLSLVYLFSLQLFASSNGSMTPQTQQLIDQIIVNLPKTNSWGFQSFCCCFFILVWEGSGLHWCWHSRRLLAPRMVGITKDDCAAWLLIPGLLRQHCNLSGLLSGYKPSSKNGKVSGWAGQPWGFVESQSAIFGREGPQTSPAIGCHRYL
jgi:hypothetical protein